MHEYTVLLNYPNYEYPNSIHQWVRGSNEWREISNGMGEIRGNDKAKAQVSAFFFFSTKFNLFHFFFCLFHILIIAK